MRKPVFGSIVRRLQNESHAQSHRLMPGSQPLTDRTEPKAAHAPSEDKEIKI